eukprot:6193535-Pleurochrysis_carterae.AAC.1
MRIRLNEYASEYSPGGAKGYDRALSPFISEGGSNNVEMKLASGPQLCASSPHQLSGLQSPMSYLQYLMSISNFNWAIT